MVYENIICLFRDAKHSFNVVKLSVKPAYTPNLKLQLLVLAWYIMTQTILFAPEMKRISYT